MGVCVKCGEALPTKHGSKYYMVGDDKVCGECHIPPKVDEQFIIDTLRGQIEGLGLLYNAMGVQVVVSDRSDGGQDITMKMTVPRTGSQYSLNLIIYPEHSTMEVINKCGALAWALHRTFLHFACKHFSAQPDFFDRLRNLYCWIILPFVKLFIWAKDLFAKEENERWG